jgi:RNA polymerase sigma-70 factor (ECF subfamily)
MDGDLREIFVLYEIEDMTGEEISQMLSIPLGTVYSRLQLARKAFKRAVVRMESGNQTPVVRAGGRA